MFTIVGSGLLAPTGAAPVAAPTVADFDAQSFSNAQPSHSIVTSGVNWTGEKIISLLSFSGGVNFTGIAGSTDDTASLVRSNTASGASLITHSWTINGALDASFNTSHLTSERLAAGLLLLSGAGAVNDSNGASQAAAGGVLSPVCPALTTTVDKCLVLRAFGATGGGSLVAIEAATPAGHTFLFAAVTAPDVSASGQCKIGVAAMVQATAGPVPAATWTNALGDDTNIETQSIAWEPA
jgi:hypothetical protein